MFPAIDLNGRPRTAYAITCRGSDVGVGITHQHGLVYLTRPEYLSQMRAANYGWRCPLCNGDASWSDENYEQFDEGEP